MVTMETLLIKSLSSERIETLRIHPGLQASFLRSEIMYLIKNSSIKLTSGIDHLPQGPCTIPHYFPKVVTTSFQPRGAKYNKWKANNSPLSYATLLLIEESVAITYISSGSTQIYGSIDFLNLSNIMTFGTWMVGMIHLKMYIAYCLLLCVVSCMLASSLPDYK